MLSTASGSVGEISAPNKKQLMRGVCGPIHRKTHQLSSPTTSVDRATPTVANVAMATRCDHRSATSKCSAPANSKKPSIPCNNVRSNGTRSIAA